ncbi:SRPBCC domain-containing protein [Dyadobacter sp. CY323]|uniref:SRPBCC domain-containing protein n=1 Tax=Dyadobacter sp. CY323 TaxID=2907302 RepID=UPI001F20593E|nr:SRPBCC domain-containing protein [Dyadobacter sp. CY323]MCE6992019.1 SRPBCC domain-containing protein [Dyadobacter sp. CY323]
MSGKNTTRITAEKGKQEFFIEREFEAPRELVFRTFNEPEFLLQWMGPSNMEMRIDKLDNRSGGSYRFVHSLCNGGGEFGFNGVIHEVSAPERLIRTFEFEGLPERGHVSLEFLTLTELPGNRTRVHIQSVFKSVEDRDGLLQSGMEGGLNEGYNKLDELLASSIINN